MDILSFLGNSMFTIAAAVLGTIFLIVLVRFAQKNYIKVPNHVLAVVSGQRLRYIRGGATLVIPFLERVDQLDLTTITIPNLIVKDVVTKEGVQVTVKGVAQIKIGSSDALARAAAERLMGKKREEIQQSAFETLEAHLRGLLGTMTVEQVNSDRPEFQRRMISESSQDLARLGLEVDVLAIKELDDNTGYLKALGQARTAEVKRDATIGAAKADREATILSTTAQQEAEVKRQQNEAIKAEAEKDKDVKIAQYLAQTEAEQARAAQAGPLATAEARKAVVQKEQEVDLARTQKATEVAEAEAARQQQVLVATVIRPAEAKKQANIAEAEGVAQAKKIEAEAEKARLIAHGEGEAEAARLKLYAEADGVRAKLLAEAEGVLKKAEAYKALNDAGRLLQILEAAQTLLPSAIREFGTVVAGAAKPFGEADKIVILDSGSSGNGHGGAIERFAGITPNLVFGLLERFKALGVDATGLLDKVGINDDKVVNGHGPAA
jgi:flotillin